MKKNKHCIIVGSGLAGLAAAHRLRLRGCRVTVLEGRNRLGGRVLTHHFYDAPELNCELGGEWIGSDHRRMLELCDEFGLRTQKHQFANSFWNGTTPAKFILPGEWCMSPESLAIWRKFQIDFKKYGLQRQKKMDRIDWWTQLHELGFGPEDLLRRDLMDSTDFGETIRMNSALTAATEYLDSPGQRVDDTDEMDYKIRGGNSRLIAALACKIGLDNICTEQTVRGIRQIGPQVRVDIQGVKQPLLADYCICAIPAHCMSDIDWGPRPPREKLAAAAQLQYARITKTAVLCSHRFWDPPAKGGFSVCTNLASDFTFDSTFRQKGKKRILCSYAVGDKAVDIASSPQDKLKYWIVEDVAHSRGLKWTPRTSRKIALDSQQQAWQADPFTRGAYAFYRPGQWFTVRPALQKPFGRIFFAGEHIAEWQGFMEGAVETGYAAAKAVLRA